jgi:hypothetical protein
MDKGVLRKWLQAGYMEKHVFHPTEEGTPQGGIATPPTILQTFFPRAGLYGMLIDPRLLLDSGVF